LREASNRVESVAPGSNSECLLKPVRIYEWQEHCFHYIVLCEVMNPDGTPHKTNTRSQFTSLHSKTKNERFWFGFEQEYFITKDFKPLGFPPVGYPKPQGLYYCGVGGNQVVGRKFAHEHLQECLFMGIELTGINAEVAVGQWEYQAFYEESFDVATACFDADPYATIKALFRAGKPKPLGKTHVTALVRKDGGWFGGAAKAPDVLLDDNVLTDGDLHLYGSALKKNGFFGPCSYYMNHAKNAEYASQEKNGGVLEMPVLFLPATFDYTCECIESNLAKPMTEYCNNLTTLKIDSGHWMAQEKPLAVNAALVRWLAADVVEHWPPYIVRNVAG